MRPAYLDHTKSLLKAGAPRLLITLTSSDFDAYLEWGEESGGGFETVDSDDDSGGGTNSQLEVNNESLPFSRKIDYYLTKHFRKVYAKV